MATFEVIVLVHYMSVRYVSELTLTSALAYRLYSLLS